jgi:glycosyltransferase involved in cell wall biosynthesis
MIDRSPARLSVVRRWMAELNPFRITVVGKSTADGIAVADSARERIARFLSFSHVVPRRLRPNVAQVETAEDLENHWDMACCFGLDSQSRHLATDAVEALRSKARFVVAAIPTEGPSAWPVHLRRELKPLSVQAFGGEELCLLRGGESVRETRGQRVWYLAPNRQIYGGVKILYNHVDILSTIGVNAVLAVDDAVNWPAQWFPWNPERQVFGENARESIGPEDIVVIPEFRYRDAVNYPHAKRRLLFVQNQGLAKGIGEWEGLGYDGVLTLGRPDGIPSFLEDYLMRRHCRLPMFAIPNHFDDDGWVEVAERKNPGSILCLPRKGPEFVAGIVREFGDAVTCVENAHQLEMAAAYSQADVYVHTGFPEGLGMPIVESMLTGCVACGFAGGGGLDVMSDGKTAYLASDGNMSELLTVVRRALNSPMREEVREAGQRAAARFNRAAAQAALDQCFRRWLPSLPIAKKPSQSRRSLFATMLGR